MDIKQLFHKYRKRLVAEGALKSALIGAAVALGINFIFSTLYWIWAFGSITLGPIAGLMAGISAGEMLYFWKFKPTELAVARRIDRYGMRERMVTMLELKDSGDTVAALQRQDAEDKLSSFFAKSIRLRIPRVIVAAFAVALIMSATSLTLGALAGAGVIPHANELFASGADGKFDIVYTAGEGGSVIGDTEQEISPEGEGTPVVAVAEDGYIFVGWSDGEKYPERRDKNLTENTEIFASFEKIDKAGGKEGEEDFPNDLPHGTTESSGGGSSGDEGGENTESGESGQGGGKWQDKNQFLDGATYYRDYLELYYQYATGIFENETDIPEELIEFFEIYFKGI